MRQGSAATEVQKTMFLVLPDDQVLDYDLDLLTEVLDVIDERTAAALASFADPSDLDQFGEYDRAEHAAGLGFVACQGYLTAICSDLGIHKRVALGLGPCHRLGAPVAQVVNAAANYWKHRGEWVLEGGAAGQERVIETFEALGFASVKTDYPLCWVLEELTAPARATLAAVVPMLAAWRDELRRLALSA